VNVMPSSSLATVFSNFSLLSSFPGDYETFVAMLLDGYDHVVDVNDNDGVSIAQVAKARGHHELAAFLDQLRDFEVRCAN
jgi:hypothetical protein